MKTWQKILFGTLWLTAISYGMFVLLAHSYAPGRDDGLAPNNWPVQSSIPTASGKSTLVMFIHPKCPCTRASLNELAVLMTHCQNLVNASVMAVQPDGVAPDWVRTDLYRSANSIPGVVVRVDNKGEEAHRFHATTSGQVVLYDRGGRLLFSGGITAARGHEGDNAGLSDIMEMLHGRVAVQGKTPVFGCSLLNPESKCTLGNQCKP
jgi:hypothetical protein